MAKLPCNDCGTLILPTTAESTGGVCMACKQGIRKDIEASRAFYEAQKRYDPFRELWKSLVERSRDNAALRDWAVAEQLYFSVCLLEGEMYNGGFDQYFSNSSGDYYNFAVDGLSAIQAEVSLGLAREAAEVLFGRRGPPPRQEERWRVMSSKTRQLTDVVTRRRRAARLEMLDKQFYEDSDGLSDRLRAYAEQEGLILPFERDPAKH
ncbi:DMP19 family protein [Sphingomonas sp. R647]|uniref:DMP19 family protein n=1 Tax=Sphingomonas sp. R647 TaxID=2875233 RepID=UPI001CD73C37|nr:DUF4375 domain-containing protein [Sphingomonas sp. R647]MCA1196685.1 DMP19 family protein [Sphingomonas sp. R647]